MENSIWVETTIANALLSRNGQLFYDPFNWKICSKHLLHVKSCLGDQQLHTVCQGGWEAHRHKRILKMNFIENVF